MKKITLKVMWNALLLSLPSIVGISMGYLALSSIMIFVISILLFCFGVFAINKRISVEEKFYQKQKTTGEFADPFYFTHMLTSMLWSFIGLFFSLGSFLYFTIDSDWEVFGLFIIPISIAYHLWFLDGKNWTDYKILEIPFSEFEILGYGNKQFQFKVSILIYGDENSDENLKIINQNITFQLPLFKEQLMQQKETL